MSDRKTFASVWDTLEDSPEGAARMKVLSALKMGLLPTLTEPLQVAAYLNHVLDGDDTSATELAFRHVAQAQGLALDDDGEGLMLSDVVAILRAVGLRLNVQPAEAGA